MSYIVDVYKGLKYKLQRMIFLNSSRRNQFEKIYHNGGFGGDVESLSGAGSDLEQTAVIRAELPSLLQQYNIESILDVPCGDWYWMKHINLKGINYVGGDIVNDIVKVNSDRFSGNNIKFVTLDMVKDELPKVDLILCRDCLIHMKLADAQAAIENFKRSGSKWLLTTTFDNTKVNNELNSNFFRSINLQKTPFFFPYPTESINEQCSLDEGAYPDKCLSLWRISELP